MSAKKSENPATSGKDFMTETSVRVGKALGRSAARAEAGGRKIKKAAEEIVGSVARKQPKAAKTTAKRGKPSLAAPKGLTLNEQLGFLAGDIYNYLADAGTTEVERLVNVLMQRKNTQATIYAAIGWLAREGKLRFSDDGRSVALA